MHYIVYLQNSRLVRNQDFFSLKLYEYTDDYKYYDNHIISYLFHDLHFCNILCSTPKLRFSERGRQTTFVH